MSITASAGTVSHLDRITTVSETRHGIRTERTLAFRLDGHPVTYRFGHGTQLDNGDVVTATGRQRGGHFEIWALRNETTGVIYECLAMRVMVCSVVLLVIGLWATKVCVGFLVLPLAPYLFFKFGLPMKKANELLRATPARTQSIPQAPTPPPLPPSASTQRNLPSEIYLVRNGQQSGPHSPAELMASLAAGILTPGDLAWHNGITEWVPLGSIIK